MSVDYYVCNYCGETFPDCGKYISCECGNRWCSDECAEADGFRVDVDTDKEYDTSCAYCRGEKFEDYEILDKALELLKMSRDELIKLMN